MTSVLDEMCSLDPRRDCQRITHLVSCRAFPFDMTRSLELALFRTFCSPRIRRGGSRARSDHWHAAACAA